MNSDTYTDSEVYMCGEVKNEPRVWATYRDGSHSYAFDLKTNRLSGIEDTVTAVVRNPNKFEDWSGIVPGCCVSLTGLFKSLNRFENGRHRLILYIQVDDIEILVGDKVPSLINSNEVHLTGFLCKLPTYRKTPLGREICDVLIAVNRNNRDSDYIPTVCWGKNAKLASSFIIGDKVQVEGRIQSREYQKRVGDNYEKRIAYEVSARSIFKFPK